MGKLTTYIIMMSGLMLLFHFTGLIETGSTPNSALLTLLLNPEGMEANSWWSNALLAVEGLGGVGLVLVGLFTSNTELTLIAPFVAFMVNLLFDFNAVYAELASTNQVLAVLLLSPLLLLFVVTAIEWWRGRD